MEQKIFENIFLLVFTSTCVSSIFRFWWRVIFKLVTWKNSGTILVIIIKNKKVNSILWEKQGIRKISHTNYLVLHLLINNSLYRIEIKLFKLHPFVKPPIDCQKAQTNKLNSEERTHRQTLTEP